MTTKKSGKIEGVPASHSIVPAGPVDYGRLVADITTLLDQARRAAVRAVNKILAPTYWEVGRRIVEFEQGGKARSVYGEKLLDRLAKDLTAKHGRGFSRSNVAQMRVFYLAWEIVQTPSGQLEARAKCPALLGKAETAKRQTPSAKSVHAFPLSWSQYVRLMAVENLKARAFYEAEAISGGWTVRQLDRQISTQFFERAMHSKNPQAMLARAKIQQREDLLPVESEIRDPYLLDSLTQG